MLRNLTKCKITAYQRSCIVDCIKDGFSIEINQSKIQEIFQTSTRYLYC